MCRGQTDSFVKTDIHKHSLILTHTHTHTHTHTDTHTSFKDSERDRLIQTFSNPDSLDDIPPEISKKFSKSSASNEAIKGSQYMQLFSERNHTTPVILQMILQISYLGHPDILTRKPLRSSNNLPFIRNFDLEEF